MRGLLISKREEWTIYALMGVLVASIGAALFLPPVYPHSDYFYATFDTPINTTTLSLLYMEVTPLHTPAHTAAISYPPHTVSGTPNVTVVNRGSMTAVVSFYDATRHIRLPSFEITPFGTAHYTLPAEGLYSWGNATRHNIYGHHTYYKNVTAPADQPADPPSPHQTLYEQSAAVHVPTNIVTLIYNATAIPDKPLAAGVPPIAATAHPLVGFVAPFAGPSWRIALSHIDGPQIANFTVAAGTNHAYTLPGSGHYQWLAQAGNATAEGRISYFN